MSAPIGVLTSDGAFQRLVYSMGELSVFGLPDGPRPADSCNDPLCYPGCWAAGFAEGETFHCDHCHDPYDGNYMCEVYPKLCPGCCGHPSCMANYYAYKVNLTHD